MKTIGNISLTSTGRSKGVGYTDAEKGTARHICLAVLIAAGLVDDESGELEGSIPSDVIAGIGSVETEGKGLPNICRAVYRQVEASHFAGEKKDEPLDEENWPKVRDYTSVGLIFRKALKALNADLKVLTDKQVDEAFPRYVSKKGKKAS